MQERLPNCRLRVCIVMVGKVCARCTVHTFVSRPWVCVCGSETHLAGEPLRERGLCGSRCAEAGISRDRGETIGTEYFLILIAPPPPPAPVPFTSTPMRLTASRAAPDMVLRLVVMVVVGSGRNDHK